MGSATHLLLHSYSLPFCYEARKGVQLPPLFISCFLGAQTAALLGIRDGSAPGGLRSPLSVFGTGLSQLNRDQMLMAAAAKVSRLLVYSTVFVGRGGNRPEFSIPDQVKQAWGVSWLS
jgi:hypothetical protein